MLIIIKIKILICLDKVGHRFGVKINQPYENKDTSCQGYKEKKKTEKTFLKQVNTFWSPYTQQQTSSLF